MKSILSFFSTKSVREKLIKGTLSEGQLFIYFYFIMMYDAVGLTQQCLAMIGKQPSIVDLVKLSLSQNVSPILFNRLAVSSST